ENNPDFKIEITASSAGIPYPDLLKEVENGKYDALVLPSNLGEQTVIDQQKLDVKASEPVAINNTFVLIHRSFRALSMSSESALFSSERW
ncbi:amino acid ABC transporter substrate-binding protein, partial [Rhizobium ruizarguesonis]